jgi:hypothetical protein
MGGSSAGDAARIVTREALASLLPLILPRRPGFHVKSPAHHGVRRTDTSAAPAKPQTQSTNAIERIAFMIASEN